MSPYSFRFQHPRALRYVWLTVFGPIVVLIAVILLAGPSMPAILISTLGTMALGFYLLFTKGKAADQITLDSKGFTSAFFGRVEFGDIAKVSGQSFWMEPPSLRIVLANGKQLTWRLTYKGSVYNSVADAEVFMQFTSDLSARMDTSTAARPAAAAYYHAGIGPTPAEQLRKVKDKNRKPAWMIPIGAVFAVLALVKTCGKDWFGSKDPDFGKMAAQQEKLYNYNVERAKAVMAEHLKTQGALFLYTNDTAATASLLPKISEDNPLGIKAFRHTQANQQLREFIDNPGAFDIQTVILAGDASVTPMRKSILNMDDSAGANLYIRFYDPAQRIVPMQLRGQAIADSSELPVFDVKSAIALYDTLALAKPISEVLPGMPMMLAQVRHRPSFRIYLTGREKDGITESLFRKTIRELNRQLNKVEADTGRFVMKVYNR